MRNTLIRPSVLLLLAMSFVASGQFHQTLTESDYDRATAMLSGNVSKFVDKDVRPQWLEDGRLWYRSRTADEEVYKLFNPADGKWLTADSRTELFDLASVESDRSRGSRTEVISPDGNYAAFIRDWNLWIREVETGEETQLTHDGVENFGYATDNAGWKRSDRPILSWSPDSRKIATFQQDQRHVSDMYLVKTRVGAPELVEWKYPLPGDEEIIRIYRVIIDISGEPNLVRLKMDSDARRGTLCDDISCEGGFDDISWS